MIRIFQRFLEKYKDRIALKKFELAILNREKSREEDIESLIQLWKTFQSRKITSYDNFFNVCIFATLVGRDIDFLSDSFVKTLNIREKNIIARLLSMTIIEFLDDINTLLGKNLRIELGKSGMTHHVENLNNLNKEFATIKKNNQNELRAIRNNASAHKTKNSIHLLEFSNNLELKKILDLSLIVRTTNTKLTRFTTKIIHSIMDRSLEELNSLKEQSKNLDTELKKLKH